MPKIMKTVSQVERDRRGSESLGPTPSEAGDHCHHCWCAVWCKGQSGAWCGDVDGYGSCGWYGRDGLQALWRSEPERFLDSLAC